MFALLPTTYYVYTLDDRPPQALMRRCFGARKYEGRGKIVAWQWIYIDVRDLDPGNQELWRREDWELVRRTAG